MDHYVGSPQADIPALNLIFTDSKVRCGGEIIHGDVDLYFPTLYKDEIEEVYVKLKGNIITKITRSTGQSAATDRKKIDLLREEYLVWRKGEIYPPPNSDTLRLHFQFRLPNDLPPSIQTSKRGGWARIQYHIKLVGARPGMLQSNRRIVRVFPVVPLDPIGLPNRLALEQGWKGDWMTKYFKKELRRGIWGGFSKVAIEFSLPSLSSLPLYCRIPVVLRVVTHTKPTTRDKELKYDSDGRLFPSPPLRPSDVQMTLRRTIFMKAKSWKLNYPEDALHVGGCRGSSYLNGIANIEVMEKSWEAFGKGNSKGVWMQESVLQSYIDLNLPPTFSVDKTLTASYTLLVKVIFPGLGNDGEIEIPVAIASAMTPDQQPNRPMEELGVAPPTYDQDEGDSYIQPL